MSKLQTALHSHIDFEHWSQLARTDPERFEQLRHRTLNECIARSSRNHQKRLRGLQWRIDRVRDKAGTPLAACLEISTMMWDTFHQLGELYNQAEALQQGKTVPKPDVKQATILPFAPPESTEH